jgi:hypothetical protein
LKDWYLERIITCTIFLSLHKFSQPSGFKTEKSRFAEEHLSLFCPHLNRKIESMPDLALDILEKLI